MSVTRVKAGDSHRCAPKQGELICVRVSNKSEHKHFGAKEMRIAQAHEREVKNRPKKAKTDDTADAGGGVDDGDLLFEVYAEICREARTDKDPESVRYAMKRAYPHFKVQVKNITELRLRALQKKLMTKYKYNTVEVTMHYVKTVTRTAYRAGLMPSLRVDPTEGVKMPPRDSADNEGVVTKDDIPNQAEALLIHRGTPERYRWGTALAFGCGMRVGEIIGVCPNQLDLATGILTIDEQEQRRGRVSPKRRRSNRKIKLPEWVLFEMRRAIKAHPYAADVPLFTGPRSGRPRRDNFYNWAWKPALKAAKLTEKGYTVHHARHFCASDMLERGYKEAYVADFLGDAVETIREVYTHWLRDSDPGVAEDTRFGFPRATAEDDSEDAAAEGE